MKPVITIPITVLTKKVAPNKQDSVFYAGHNIAEVKIRNRLYVLTTAGHYQFSLEENRTPVSFDSDTCSHTLRVRAKVIPKLTDAKIKAINDNDLASSWGWFGINVWEDDTCLPEPTDAYSSYDEAMKAFIKYVEKAIKG